MDAAVREVLDQWPVEAAAAVERERAVEEWDG